jgi:hypothetical protein
MPRQQRASQDKFVTTYCHLFRKKFRSGTLRLLRCVLLALVLNRSNASEGKSHHVIDIGSDIIDLAREGLGPLAGFVARYRPPPCSLRDYTLSAPRIVSESGSGARGLRVGEARKWVRGRVINLYSCVQQAVIKFATDR